MSRQQSELDPNAIAFTAAWQELSAHPMFRPLTGGAWPRPSAGARLVDSADLGLARVATDGTIRANRTKRLDQAQWTWVLAHCLLHLGFGHLDPGHGHDAAFRDVACLVVTRFQRAVKLGTEPELFPATLPRADEHVLLRQWRRDGVPAEFAGCGAGTPDLTVDASEVEPGHEPQWPERFALGLSAAASAAVDVAGGARTS